jgi:hypothetical protein
MLKKHSLPTIADFNLNIDLNKLQIETDKLANKFVDVETANPMLCNNHSELVKSVYDNFEQINLTMPEKVLSYTTSIKERLKRKEEFLYNIPSPEYKKSYFEEIINQLKANAIRVRITKLAPGKFIPFHVDYDVNYAVRCICPIYSDNNVINMFKRNNKIESYILESGHAYFLNIGYPHAVVNMSNNPRIALMFSLDSTQDIKNL